MIAELVLAMRVLRVAMGQFGYPTLLAANAAARALLSTAETMLWDEHSELVLEPALAALDRTLERKRGLRKRKRLQEDGRLRPWLYKMQALLSSPFERTVYLDGDMYVLNGRLLRTLLTRTLRIADFAMPIDPWRGGAWGLAAAPALCAALVAARTRATGVREFVLAAAGRMVNGSHRHLHPDVQTGDQSMYWFEWVAAPSRSSAVRLLPLPSEFFCPNEPLSRTHVLRDGELALEPFAHFLTSWKGPSESRRRGMYQCGAVHGHGYSAEQLQARRVSPAEINDRVRSAGLRQPFRSSATSEAGATSDTNQCPSIDYFDSSKLPYWWVPGLEFRQAPADETYYRTAERIEVSHTFDYTAGPLWLYVSPGSGNWWAPGTRVVANNLVDAILRWRTPADVAVQLEGRKDWADYGQWRSAFGTIPWEEVLRSAATGNASFEMFASAGELLDGLLTPPTTVNSVILIRQLHYWPRWFDEEHDGWRYGYAPRLVHDDAGATTFATDVNSRVRRVPEIVDFRVQGNDKYKWFWKRQLLRGDAQGRTTCSKGPAAAACVSCGMRMHVLCECAFRKAPATWYRTSSSQKGRAAAA